MIGSSLGRYRILAAIGAGGMGDVYRARDEALGREVAVKVLPERFSQDLDRLARFEREARAAANLGHPNILAVHDVGRHEGSPYIVTELLEGRTLREVIADGLTVGKAVELAVQVAQGLAAAHERGVVHRDLKPSNLFVTRDGVVKILDFGLAKLLEPAVAGDDVTAAAPEPPPTASGTVLGTMGYMAPEQVRGQAVDHRADIFALGCVLYEMLTGRRAFRGDTTADTAAAILSLDPPPLTASGKPIPPALDRVASRCLQKRPEDRFQSARDVAFALQVAGGAAPEVTVMEPPTGPTLTVPLRRAALVLALLVVAAVAVWITVRWRSGGALPAARHVAVLPFVAADATARSHALAAALTETVTSGLTLLEAQHPDAFWVLPRRYAAGNAEEVHRKFNVSLALTGRVRVASDQVRLELALLDAASARRLRAATLEESLGNASSLQREPTLRAAGMLGIAPAPDVGEWLAAGATNVTPALEAYLVGIGELDEDGRLEDAITKLREAVAADPLFPAARVALAHALLCTYERGHDEKALTAGIEEAKRAAGKGPMAAQAYQALAELQRAAGRREEAVSALEEAVHLAPWDGEAALELGQAYQAAGKPDAAEEALQRAIYLRPGYWPGYHALARLFYGEGEYEAAVTEWRHVVEAAPQYQTGYNNLGVAYFSLGRREEARQAFERSLQVAPEGNYIAYSNLGTLYFEASRYRDAVGAYEKALAINDDDYRVWGNLGHAYRYGASPEKARAPYRRALELGERRLAEGPAGPELLADLAGYCAGMGDRARGGEFLQRAVALAPSDPEVIASIAETYEDLGQRKEALEWVSRAFHAGVRPHRFEDRPALRDLLADPRYQALAAGGPENRS